MQLGKYAIYFIYIEPSACWAVFSLTSLSKEFFFKQATLESIAN